MNQLLTTNLNFQELQTALLGEMNSLLANSRITTTNSLEDLNTIGEPFAIRLSDIVANYYFLPGGDKMDEDAILKFIQEMNSLIQGLKIAISAASFSNIDRFILSWAWYLAIANIARELEQSRDTSMRLTGINIERQNIDMIGEFIDQLTEDQKSMSTFRVNKAK